MSEQSPDPEDPIPLPVSEEISDAIYPVPDDLLTYEHDHKIDSPAPIT